MKQTILEWYQEKHKFIDAPCNGKGDCGRCKIKFLSNAPEAGDKDRKLLSAQELEQGIRLACSTEKTDREDFVLAGDIFAEGIQVTSSEMENPEELKHEQETSYGIALDIGTTTLAMRLVGLETKKSFLTLTAVNHQRAYGADVISRIQAANQGKLQELQKCIQQDVFEMLVKLVTTTGIRIEQIKKIVIVGNTTMCHLLLGYSCEGLGQAPFKPVSVALTKINVEKLFETIELSPIEEAFLKPLDAEVVILPGVSAFVGADIVAGMYYCDMDMKDKPHMLLDIGTNGEMVLGDKQGFYVTSTAAGPVFEGGNISCGMPATKGATTHIKKSGCEVVGNVEPQGISGSGLVDLAALMLEENVIDENGTLCDAYFESGYPIEIGLEKKATGMKITQSDIRELQMGKAAIRAGAEVLTQKKMPEYIYLAGGFGVAIDVVSAERIGLFSKEQAKRIVSRGNTALEGAHKFLLDEDGEKRVSRIAKNAREIVLAQEADFEEKYIHFLQFLI